jgi:hypothetical protein
MNRRLGLAALLSAVCVSFCVSETRAGDVYYYAPQPVFATPYYAQQPVFYGPPTVVVQRPVVIAQPVVVPEPVFVEVPTVYVQPSYVETAYVQPAPVAYGAYPTSYHYRGHVFPFGPHAREEYRVYTPYGVHKYKHKYSWLTGYRFEYDFDD